MYKSHTKLLCRNKWQKWSHTVFVLQFPTPGRNRMVKLWQSTAIKEIQRNTNFDNFRSFHWPLMDTNDNFTPFIALLKKWKHKFEVAMQWDEGSLDWNSEYNREWKSEIRLLQMWAHCAWTRTRKLQCTAVHWTPKVLLFSRVWAEAKSYFCARVSGYCAEPCQSLSLESWFYPCQKQTHRSPCIYLLLQQWDSQTTAGLHEK